MRFFLHRHSLSEKNAHTYTHWITKCIAKTTKYWAIKKKSVEKEKIEIKKIMFCALYYVSIKMRYICMLCGAAEVIYRMKRNIDIWEHLKMCNEQMSFCLTRNTPTDLVVAVLWIFRINLKLMCKMDPALTRQYFLWSCCQIRCNEMQSELSFNTERRWIGKSLNASVDLLFNIFVAFQIGLILMIM